MIRLTAYWGFIVIGIGNTMLGPALLSILATFHRTPAEAGPLFFVSSLGYTCAVLVGGPAGDRWGRRLLLLCGALIYALGTAAFFLAPVWALAVLAIGVLALGGGVIDSGTNALANDIAAPERHAAEQSMLHTFFGIGALLGPLLIGAVLALHAGWRPAYAIVAVCAVALAALLGRVRLPVRAAHATPTDVRAVLALAANRLLVVLGMLIGVYVGAEIVVGDWAAAYLQRIQGLSSVTAAACVGLYWGGLAAGRFLSALAARRYSGGALLSITCIISLLASVALVLAGNVVFALVALTLCGLGYAAVFPLVMALAGTVFPTQTGSVAGLLIGWASVCGAILPWVAGILVQYADARAALAVSVPSCAVMLVLAEGLRRRPTQGRVPVPVAADRAL